MAQVRKHGDLSSEAVNHWQNIAQQHFDDNRSALAAANEDLHVALTYISTLRKMLLTQPGANAAVVQTISHLCESANSNAVKNDNAAGIKLPSAGLQCSLLVQNLLASSTCFLRHSPARCANNSGQPIAHQSEGRSTLAGHMEAIY